MNTQIADLHRDFDAIVENFENQFRQGNISVVGTAPVLDPTGRSFQVLRSEILPSP